MYINHAIFYIFFFVVIWAIFYPQKFMRVAYCTNFAPFTKIAYIKSKKQNISFFRESEPFLHEKDAKKFLYDIDFMQSTNQKLLENARKQSIMNGKKGSFSSALKHIGNKLLVSLYNLFSKCTTKDYITLGIYIIIPIILITVSNIEKINLFISSIITPLMPQPLDWYFSQLSLTFITISVMSIFSDGDVVVYWQNIVKQMLIEPPARCFRAFFIYSFIYLLGSTLAIFSNKNIMLLIFFLFNIICLFDLSKIMINCYYGQNSRKKKMLKEFINEIEKANVVALEIKENKTEASRTIDKKRLDDIINTFDNFYFFTNDAFNKQNYLNAKENISIYGKLLARVNSAAMSDNEFPLMDWYNDKTYKAYRKTVENYYMEYESLIRGNGFSATSALDNGIEKKIIHNILITLSNDIHYPRETTICFELLLYRLIVTTYYLARYEDFDNLNKYFCIESPKGAKEHLYKSKIPENIRMLANASEPNRSKLINAIESFIADTVLIDTTDCYILNFGWLSLDSLGFTNETYSNMLSNIEEKVIFYSDTLSEERKEQCLNRINYISFTKIIPSKTLKK